MTDKTSLDGENSVTSSDIDLDETDRMDLDEFFVSTWTRCSASLQGVENQP